MSPGLIVDCYWDCMDSYVALSWFWFILSGVWDQSGSFGSCLVGFLWFYGWYWFIFFGNSTGLY